jgi:hypothetical protein
MLPVKEFASVRRLGLARRVPRFESAYRTKEPVPDACRVGDGRQQKQSDEQRQD